jgi:hypothetical protein
LKTAIPARRPAETAVFMVRNGPRPKKVTVPKTYPRFDNAAFFAILAALRINKLRGINAAQ